MANDEVMLSVKLVEAWLTVHGYLCLALRHPKNRGPSREHLVKFVKRLGRVLVEWRVLTEEQLRHIEKVEVEKGTEDFSASTASGGP